MAAVASDNAGCFVPTASGDTIAGPIYVDRVKWHGGAIAATNQLKITGLATQDTAGDAIADGGTRGVIFDHTASAADEVWTEYIGRTFRDILIDTWTSNNGTCQIHARPAGDAVRRGEL